MKTFIKLLTIFIVACSMASCDKIEKIYNVYTKPTGEIKNQMASAIKDSLSIQGVDYESFDVKLRKIEAGKYWGAVQFKVQGVPIWLSVVVRYDGEDTYYNKDLFGILRDEIEKIKRSRERERQFDQHWDELKKEMNSLLR
jgi:hypothetical protein